LDVAKHNSASSLWVIREGKIYDLTAFASDHPGGSDLIAQFAGKDLEDAMEDPREHIHSDSAYEVLSDYQIGRVGTEESIVREDIVIDDDFEPEETDISSDFKKNQFLDLNRPLIPQVWFSNFSKDFYLQQVHQPRHLPYSAKLFGPWYLEMFTLTPWYIIPLFWLPIVGILIWKCLNQQMAADPTKSQQTAISWAIGLFLVGNFLWTIIEYGMWVDSPQA
jgi:4-hydroxysphinganine ceramide fatty acyl 2-hydroxylase